MDPNFVGTLQKDSNPWKHLRMDSNFLEILQGDPNFLKNSLGLDSNFLE